MKHPLSRREFLESAAKHTALMVLAPGLAAGCRAGRSAGESLTPEVPSYLKGFEDLYKIDPRQAARTWFRQARFGLFMHFGIYSILGRGEWVQLRDRIPLAEYEKLKDEFDPERFDADFITDMALEAGMRYVNITARHHDSFCLFESEFSDYSSADSPAGRDLIAELADQCRNKGLGLFLYYSYALDWRHPYFYSRKHWKNARPAYEQPETRYKWQRDEDFRHYIAFVHGQLRELLTRYGPLAGIWLDPIMGFYARPDLYPIRETYAMIRKLQPQVLISFKQGATGDEDFAAPEGRSRSLADNVAKQFGEKRAEMVRGIWEKNRGKHNEICDVMQQGAWGYREGAAHKDADAVMNMLGAAFEQNCNLLLNTGPLPDGSIHADDVATLKETGRRIEAQGWPV